MKKIIIGSLITVGALFAYPGMTAGNYHAGGAFVGKPMAGLTDNTVVAEFNGKKITVKDVNAYLQGLTGDDRITLQKLPAQHVKALVQRYIQTLEIYQKAKSITNTPQYKAAAMKLADDMWLKQRLAKIKVSDAEAKKFYEENKNIYFKTPPMVKARHILVKSEKEAEKLIAELKGLHGKALEQKFAELAKKYSIGPSKIQGGELGWFNPKQMVPNFAKAVENMKPGEITLKPVHTRFGYHIILLEGKQKNGYIPFEKVKGQIVAYLKRIKLQKEIQKLEKSADVKYLLPKK